MSDYIITIDGGTTNTRCILWNNKREKVDEGKRNVGVRNTAIDGNNGKLKAAVKEILEELLSNNGLSYDDIRLIIASGMLTSDSGLVEIPHVTAPADAEDLAQRMTAVSIEDICPIPIHFIPGVKNAVSDINANNFESMDIMRGEEVESIAIIDALKSERPMLLILPGSHNKFVSVDASGKITGCLTSISGELLSSITNDTIIAKSVNREYVRPETYDKDYLMMGYTNAKNVGIGRACFSARILNLFHEKDTTKLANYILGVALQCDITALQNTNAIKIEDGTVAVVYGKEPFKSALLDILGEESLFSEVITFEPPKDFTASAMGAYLVAANRLSL